MDKTHHLPGAASAPFPTNASNVRLDDSRSRAHACLKGFALLLTVWLAATPMRAVAATAPAKNLGTGFFVSGDGHFVTAGHVTGGCGTLGVSTPDGVMAADLVARSEDDDVAVIKTRRPSDVHGRFGADPARAFRRALTITRFLHEGGLGSGSTTTARFIGKTSARGGRFAIRARDTIAGGNSGAPVVDDGGGVVGMVVARARKDPRIGIAVDAFTITEFLSQSGVTIETIGSAAPPAGGAAVARAYTFPMVCLRAEKE